MRLEERQIDGHEFEQDRQREKSPLEEKRTDDLMGVGADELRGTGHVRHEHLLDVMRAIIEDRTQVELTHLGLPQREMRALEALQVAVTGRSADKHQFVYAEDRRTMLEQALAILQPDLISHDPQVVTALREQLAELTDQVTELREQLLNLEDGQDDLADAMRARAKSETGESDESDDAGDAGDKTETPEGEQTSSLYGPERKAAAKPATTLTGPEVKAEKKESTLAGPERAQATAAPSTLGDADEIAAAAKKKPWWRRVIGG